MVTTDGADVGRQMLEADVGRQMLADGGLFLLNGNFSVK